MIQPPPRREATRVPKARRDKPRAPKTQKPPTQAFELDPATGKLVPYRKSHKSKPEYMEPHRQLVVIAQPPKAAGHKPTQLYARQVKELKGMGLTHAQVAYMIGVTEPTLNRYYKAELNLGMGEQNLAVARNLFFIATSPTHKSAAAAAMFSLRTKGGFVDTSKIEMSGPGGGALQVQHDSKIDSRTLTPEQRDLLKELMIKAVANQEKLIAEGKAEPEEYDVEEAEFTPELNTDEEPENPEELC